MATYRFDSNNVCLSAATEAADAHLVNCMRLVLAVSVVLAVFVEPAGLSATHGLTWLVFGGYLFHSAVIYSFSQLNHRQVQRRLIVRLDVIWFALIVVVTGGVNSFFFPFFFFAILASSFRWGLEEGAKITIASAILFIAGALMMDARQDGSQLLLRTIFLLSIGYLSVTWGESKLKLMRQLVLLREVNQLSNPRFGVDHTIANLLEKTRYFYRASSCVLVLEDKPNAGYFIWTAKEGLATQSIRPEALGATAGAFFVAQSRRHLVAYSRSLWPILALGRRNACACELGQHRWLTQKSTSSENLAELLEARSFISTPVKLMDRCGRLYVVSRNMVFSKADALFLSQITAQTFPVIENIEFLDRMVTNATSQERRKISLDIHDRTLQPYIGLKLGLNAIQHKAGADNPVMPELEKLVSMVDSVIADLRKYTTTFKAESSFDKPILLDALKEQACRVKELYDIDITVCMDSKLSISDRLTAEVLLLVRESLSNICKHTMAHSGMISIQCSNGWLTVQIENENTSLWPTEFMPKSISERAVALGGGVQVTHRTDGNTLVVIEIPV